MESDPIDSVDDVSMESDPSALIDDAPKAGGGVDRRTFLSLSLAATAAGTFGLDPVRAQVAGAPVEGRAQGTPQQPPPPPPVPLGNGEAPALQFQPYPGGTGAMMERLARERGRAAFAA